MRIETIDIARYSQERGKNISLGSAWSSGNGGRRQATAKGHVQNWGLGVGLVG